MLNEDLLLYCSLDEDQTEDITVCIDNTANDEELMLENNVEDNKMLTICSQSAVHEKLLLSPIPSHYSSFESGYESFGSPQSDAFGDLWNESLTELFPSLA